MPNLLPLRTGIQKTPKAHSESRKKHKFLLGAKAGPHKSGVEEERCGCPAHPVGVPDPLETNIFSRSDPRRNEVFSLPSYPFDRVSFVHLLPLFSVPSHCTRTTPPTTSTPLPGADVNLERERERETARERKRERERERERERGRRRGRGREREGGIRGGELCVECGFSVRRD